VGEVRLSLGKANTTPQSPTSPSVADVREDLNRLYERLRDNPYSDSDSVRITIVGTMVYLLAQRLYK
jgi:hypothetical protein